MFYSTYQGSNYTNYNDEDYYEMWIRRNDKTENPERPWVVIKDGEYKYYGNFDWYNYFMDESRLHGNTILVSVVAIRKCTISFPVLIMIRKELFGKIWIVSLNTISVPR